MNFKYIISCIMVTSFLISCQLDNTTSSVHGESHKESHGKSHSGGHQTGLLEISSPIKKDTLCYNEYVSQIQAHQHIELKTLEEGYLHKLLVDEGQL